MNGKQLELALNNDKLCKRYFLGVFTEDLIPSLTPKKLLIFNESTSKDPLGTHWVLLSTMRRGHIDYIDSTGQDPARLLHLSQVLKDYLKREKNCKLYRIPMLQAHWSSICGAYTLVFAWFLARNQSPVDIIKDFYLNNTKRPSLLYINDIKTAWFAKTIFKLKEDASKLLYDLEYILEQKKLEKK